MGFLKDLGYIFGHGLGGYVDLKIVERRFPHLKRRPDKEQRWTELKLGMSEEQVEDLLGLPSAISTEEMEHQAQMPPPIWWQYLRDDGYIGGGAVYFNKYKKVVGFTYKGENVSVDNREGFWDIREIEWRSNKSYRSAENLRRSVRITYNNCCKTVVKRGPHTSSDASRRSALFGVFATFYSPVYVDYTEKLIRADLLPFLYLDENTTREALVEYVIYKDNGFTKDAKISWLKNVVQKGCKITKEEDDLYDEMMRTAKSIEVAWLTLLGGQTHKTYINTGCEHLITKNIDLGMYIRLKDKSLWEVSPIDKIISMLWLPKTRINVTESQNPHYPYLLINTEDGEKVEAKLISD